MSQPYFITAIGTPLNLAQQLHVEGLRRQQDRLTDPKLSDLLVRKAEAGEKLSK